MANKKPAISSKNDAPQSRFAFPKSKRILRASEFGSITDQGKRFLTKNIVVTALRSQHDTSRIGITISKKISKSSPLRNRFKRQIREAFRHLCNNIKPPHDITVNARQGAQLLTGEELKRDLSRSLEKLGILLPDDYTSR